MNFLLVVALFASTGHGLECQKTHDHNHGKETWMKPNAAWPEQHAESCDADAHFCMVKPTRVTLLTVENEQNARMISGGAATQPGDVMVQSNALLRGCTHRTVGDLQASVENDLDDFHATVGCRGRTQVTTIAGYHCAACVVPNTIIPGVATIRFETVMCLCSGEDCNDRAMFDKVLSAVDQKTAVASGTASVSQARDIQLGTQIEEVDTDAPTWSFTGLAAAFGAAFMGLSLFIAVSHKVWTAESSESSQGQTWLLA